MDFYTRKVVLIGAGMVGMSYAYAMLNQNGCDELVIIDINKERAKGEAMDLNHGLAFAASNMKISTGDYDACKNADIVVICAGVAQKPGESRLNLLKRNTAVFKSVITPVIQSGFKGIFLIATNPVDIMTKISFELSGFSPERVIGSGTALDTARLRYLLGKHFSVDPKNIHAYVMGEHGDSEFIPWSQAMIGTKSILDIAAGEDEEMYMTALKKIEEDVKGAAQIIINSKNATYYGIGMALTRITKAILGNENSVITVSAMLNDEYGIKGTYTGVPAIVNRNGIRKILSLNLNSEELEKMQKSCSILELHYKELQFPLQ